MTRQERVQHAHHRAAAHATHFTAADLVEAPAEGIGGAAVPLSFLRDRDKAWLDHAAALANS